MKKQPFDIPSGCKTVTVEQVGNTIVTTFESEKYIPEVGDCVKLETFSDFPVFYRVTHKDATKIYTESVILTDKELEIGETEYKYIIHDYKWIKITQEELQAEYAKIGYKYNFEDNTVEKLRWKPKIDDMYWSIGCRTVCLWDGCILDYWNYDNNLIFKTKQERDEALEKWKGMQV